jgi:hypothetical protein
MGNRLSSHILFEVCPLSLEHDDTIGLRIDNSWLSFSFCLKFFLVRLASQLEPFMSFLFPILHPSFLSFCHTIFLLFDLVILLDLPPHSLFYASNLDLFPWMISFESKRWGCRRLYVLLLSTFLDLRWWEAIYWSCRVDFIHPWWMSCVFIAQGYWSSSCALLHLWLNSSHDLPKLNWEFPVGVSLTKYPISTKAYYRLKNQPRHHV